MDVSLFIHTLLLPLSVNPTGVEACTFSTVVNAAPVPKFISVAPGSAWSSSGNIHVTCNNALGTDATNAARVFTTQYTVPANYWGSSSNFVMSLGMRLWSTATAPTITQLSPLYGATIVSPFVTTIAPAVSVSGGAFGGIWQFMAQGNLGSVYVTQQSLNIPGATTTNARAGNTNPVFLTEIATALGMSVRWTATGVSLATGIYTYSSGSSLCTDGSQLATATNGGGTGATGHILVSGGVPTGAITDIVTSGTGYTSQPTTWTVATCTGTGTFTTTGTLGGAMGNAIQLASFLIR